VLLLGVALLAGCGGGPKPVSESGKWATSAPGDEGFDGDRLEAVENSIPREFSGVRGIVVARHGRIVLERYYDGHDAADQFEVFSVTKSVVSMLVGIGIVQRNIGTVEQLYGDFLPEAVSAAEDERMGEVTLKQLLTMTAGFRDTQATGKNILLKLITLRKLVRPPGTKWEYDNGSAHIVSAIVHRTSGISTKQYAQETLFTPLGIRPGEWPADAEGITFGSTGLTLTVRDMATLGELYLRKGEWRGRQIVPKIWVELSIKDRVDTDDPNLGFGYFWWIGRKTNSFAAIGFGGQIIAVYPDKDLVVAITCDAANPVDTRTLLTERILPAVED
jgi:CubicO group peptidase (beta-lactamase class C family)